MLFAGALHSSKQLELFYTSISLILVVVVVAAAVVFDDVLTGPPGGNGNAQGATPAPGMTSEFVRKELKAVVGARTIHRMGVPASALGLDQAMGPGMHNNNSPPIVPGGKPLNQADLEALGLTYELPQGPT